jgi:hypothetical protein
MREVFLIPEKRGGLVMGGRMMDVGYLGATVKVREMGSDDGWEALSRPQLPIVASPTTTPETVPERTAPPQKEPKTPPPAQPDRMPQKDPLVRPQRPPEHEPSPDPKEPLPFCQLTLPQSPLG